MASDRRRAKKAIKKQVKKLVRAYGADETLKLVTGLVTAGSDAPVAKAAATKTKSKGKPTTAKRVAAAKAAEAPAKLHLRRSPTVV